jgi:hypothetical protein
MHSFSQIEVKESRNTSSLLPIKLASMISNLDLFAIVLGHIYVSVTLASQDGEAMLNFGNGERFASGLLRVNCEAKL